MVRWLDVKDREARYKAPFTPDIDFAVRPCSLPAQPQRCTMNEFLNFGILAMTAMYLSPAVHTQRSVSA